MLELFLYLMIAQALMGAFDTLYHHELSVALPRCPGARLELVIHAARALLYGLVFVGIAWFQWGGYWIFALITIVLIEVVLTLWDFVIEDQTRLLPKSERITHTLLAINGGAAFVLLATELPAWYALPSGFHFVDYGWISWFLLLSGVGVALSGIRDGLAAWSVQRLDLRLQLDLGRRRRVLISGGTGFVGSAIVREFLYSGHEITLITRRPLAAAIQFNAKIRAVSHVDELSDHEQFDAIINLAGAPVVGLPWTAHRKRIITESRYRATRDLLSFVKRMHKCPAVWVQASAIGFYGTDNELSADEQTPAGVGFAAELCQNWEDITKELSLLSVRRVVLRFGLVFGRSGGSLPMMLLSYRMWAGAILGDGRQRLAWIHIEDLLQVIARSIRDDSVLGVVNAVAPDCPTYTQFATVAAHTLQRPVFMRIPANVLQTLLGEMASMFVNGPQIRPKKLQHMAFEYRFPELRGALMDLA